MKKLISIAILFVMVAMLATTMVNAATSSTLANDLYNLGVKYGLSTSDKVKIERYLADNPVTDAQANQVMAKAQKAVAIMENAGVTDVTKLTNEQKNQLQSVANEAASVVGATLTYKNGTVEVYKDGKRVEVITFSNGKLAYTGNNINLVLVVSSVAVVALATGFVVRKKFANA